VTTFVLAPGAGGNASYWCRLVPELERLGHRALAVDLPAADPEAGLAAYADTVVRAATTALGEEPAPLVLIAQSMGGLTAPLVCDRLPVRRAPVRGPVAAGPLARRAHPGAGRPRRPVLPLKFQRRVAADRLGVGVDEVPGGHLVALSRPAELAERLVAYVAA
jgi:pimeloyl-ACP methyl ester carboxylesterase